MAETRQNQKLNHLLIRLLRSLLQYASECWPWASVDESGEQQAILEMGQVQLAHVHRLVDLLVERGWSIDFGNYPTEFTDLNYVGLDFLLGELIADEAKSITELERAQADLAGDSAAGLVAEILVAERANAAKLRELAAAHPSASTAAQPAK